MVNGKHEVGLVHQALAKAKRAMLGVFGFSFCVNVLLLTAPIFMLQVYDRVLLSRSGSTLAGLLIVAIFLLLILLVMEIVRNYLLNRISVRFDNDLSKIVLSEVLSKGSVSKPIHDVNSIRGFINAPFILALFDIPWMPLYIGLVYLLHPMLGHIGLVGAVMLFGLAIANDRLGRASSQRANEAFGAANEFVEHSSRNKDAVMGMGMLPSLTRLWASYQSAGMGFHIQASDRNAIISGVAKVIRQIIQVSILAMGGYLVIQDQTTPGVMIAASIIIGRALSPVEQSIQGWRGLTKAREAYTSLNEFMKSFVPPSPTTPLPVPKGGISLQNVFALSDTRNSELDKPQPIIKGITCHIASGESLGVIGPSGSGKSTLARLMLGIIRPLSGTIRIDGAELTTEVQKQFSPYFGYLPQDVELFDGTVADNIARFSEADKSLVIEAAKLSGAHEVILSLPDAYETRIGPSGMNISGGQRQRIGLARALYGSPSIVVLDEPTSNLDNDGRAAFLKAIDGLKLRGCTVVLIAHQPALISGMDRVAYIHDGQIQHLGPTKEIMQTLNPPKLVEKEAKPVIKKPQRVATVKPIAKRD